MNLPLNQARRELFSCVMVVSAILAVRINLPFARGAMWVRRWSGTTDTRAIAYGKNNRFCVDKEQLPRRRSVLRASAGPEFFERRFQDSGQRKRLPEFA